MSKYLPIFFSSTGEYVNCLRGIEALREPVTGCNFIEVRLKRSMQKFSINPVSIVSDSSKKITSLLSKYFNKKFGITILPSKNSKYSLIGQWFDFTKINFGQDLDLNMFNKTFIKHVSELTIQNPGSKNNVVLYGVSRGAATVFNFMAQHKPKEVSAIICEGIFDSIPNLLQYRFPLIHSALLKVLQIGTAFCKDGICPINNVAKIAHDIPILLVTSLKDKIVPCQCAMNLYRQLKANGHNKVHILILNNSGHNWYVNIKEDKDLYETVVHAFYKHYNLPYIQEFADKGELYFTQKTQPVF